MFPADLNYLLLVATGVLLRVVLVMTMTAFPPGQSSQVCESAVGLQALEFPFPCWRYLRCENQLLYPEKPGN